MSTYPIEQVLARMDKRNITRGWGAVAAFSRSRLNDQLREQHRQRLATLRFIPLFNGDVEHDDHIRTSSVLRKIEFGAPLLSFTNASLSDSKARLTFPIIAGTYKRHSPLAENLLTRLVIDEALGYTLVMEIELRLVIGEIDRRGRVTLDLAEASSFSCNLAGADEKINGLIAAAIQEHFQQLEPSSSQFELGMLELKGLTPLSPTHFRILTQAAPGAQTLGAENFGDGAVLTFIQLRANSGPGDLPEHSFPYLIPDDLDSDGSLRYSAVMVVDKAVLQHVRDDRLDVLASLLFSTRHKFVERERHIPHDLAVFGKIVAVPPLYAIDPPSQTIGVGDTQQFTLRDQAGNKVTATNWFAYSRQSHREKGDGTIDADGLYQSAGIEDIGHHSLTVVITAELEEGNQLHRVHAEVIVQFERTQVAPRVSVFAPRTPMVLSATMQAEDIEWSLSGEKRGQLDQTKGRRVTFSAEREAARRHLSIQQVQAKGTQQQRLSTLVMLNGLQSVVIEPARSVGLQPGETVDLSERDPGLLPGAQRRWRLVGPGTLDDNRRYTAPMGGEQGTSVVTCELIQNGVILASGYSLLEFGEKQLQEERTWLEINSYKIYVPGGQEGDSKGQLLNNGFQPLRLEVVIETEPVNGEYFRLSGDEQRSIGMRFLNNKQALVKLNDDDPSGGIERDHLHRWGTRTVANRFEFSYPQLFEPARPASEQGITRKNLYLHCGDRAGTSTTLYSTFNPDFGGIEASNKTESANTKVVIVPKAPPEFGDEHYSFVAKRVEGGGTDPNPNLPLDPGDPTLDPAFDLRLRTLDYWVFKLRNSRFMTVEFLPEEAGHGHISQSMIRWESEHKNEKMFSFTGAIFRDRLSKEEDDWVKPKPDVPIVFDQSLPEVMPRRKELETKVNISKYEEGSLVITNHRVPDFAYQKPGAEARDNLSRDVVVLLRDLQGNAHYRRFSFRQSGTVYHRNYIEHTLFTPH